MFDSKKDEPALRQSRLVQVSPKTYATYIVYSTSNLNPTTCFIWAHAKSSWVKLSGRAGVHGRYSDAQLM